LKSIPNYYAILGAAEDASPREIERLYKRAAHQRHPDRGGAEEDMKALNEAYRVLHDEGARKEYDANRRQQPAMAGSVVRSAAAARDVGLSGQVISALLCLFLGLLLLLLVRFNGLWFLWPMSVLAAGVVLFGVMIAHSAMTNARESLSAAHPLRRLRALQEVVFWLVIASGGYAIYLVMTTL
jgi:preprotein translocase subunit Sec63